MAEQQDALTPPLDQTFVLGDTISKAQREFLDRYGFLHFKGVANSVEVGVILEELDRVEAKWLSEGRKFVCGIPLYWGRDGDGRPFLQRFAFTSRFSTRISEFIRDPRFEPVRKLVGEDARVGEDEKDGVVVNRYLNVRQSAYKRLGWHTDGLRDLFYLRMPQEMLNVGLHLDECTRFDGGLRLLPGTHRQGFWDMCFNKLYFLSHGEDPEEICVETSPGDLTIHDGRLWHRVASSEKEPGQTLRRTMFVPYLTGPYEPKDDESRTPGYHHLGRLGRFIKRGLNAGGNSKKS